MEPKPCSFPLIPLSLSICGECRKNAPQEEMIVDQFRMVGTPSGYGLCLRIFQTLSNEEKTMSQRFIQTLRTLLSPPLHFDCICISSEFVSMAGGGKAGLGLKTLQVFVFQSSPSASRALYRHLSRSFI